MELIAVLALINWWSSFLKGVIYSTKTHAEPPFKPQPFTLAEQPDFMLSLGVSEFTLNSASYAYYSAGLLQILINESMVRGVTHHAEYLGLPPANRCYVSNPDTLVLPSAPKHQFSWRFHSSGNFSYNLSHKCLHVSKNLNSY